MSPDLALISHEQRTAHQTAALATYTANMLVQAELPDSVQQGQFELRAEYIAPRTLRFTPIRFVGDRAIKNHVINRYLQAEVQHIERQESPSTALNASNYKFSFKRLELSQGDAVYVYTVKPRRKRPGLFKGEIHLDAVTGSLRLARGRMVKSPSFFIRKIEFQQEYADFSCFTLPVRLHSTAKVRLFGRVVVDVFLRDYLVSREAVPPESP